MFLITWITPSIFFLKWIYHISTDKHLLGTNVPVLKEGQSCHCLTAQVHSAWVLSSEIVEIEEVGKKGYLWGKRTIQSHLGSNQQLNQEETISCFLVSVFPLSVQTAQGYRHVKVMLWVKKELKQYLKFPN